MKSILEGAKMKHLFIVNPAAGKGQATAMAEHIRKRFEPTSLDWRIVETKQPGHATVLARDAVADQPGINVYSVGGDGTVNEIVNGLAGTDAPLGILPCGSGNDTLRTMTDVHDPLLLLEGMIDARAVRTDLGRLNDRWFLNIASVGFDAEVVDRTRKFKKMPFVPGSLAYILGVLTALVQRNLHEVTLSLDGGEPVTASLLLAAFANGRFYGGGMQPVPLASMTDGLLDCCRVSPLSRIRILGFFPLFIKGKHTHLKEVTITPFRSLRLESITTLPVNIDGELTSAKTVEVSVHPGHLLLKRPAGAFA
jgi:diacylglycerol kinase (ATP)